MTKGGSLHCPVGKPIFYRLGETMIIIDHLGWWQGWYAQYCVRFHLFVALVVDKRSHFPKSNYGTTKKAFQPCFSLSLSLSFHLIITHQKFIRYPFYQSKLTTISLNDNLLSTTFCFSRIFRWGLVSKNSHRTRHISDMVELIPTSDNSFLNISPTPKWSI